MTAGTAVEFAAVGRVFGNTRALDGLDLRIEPGEFLALLGPSGCGKTTALRLLAGFDHPTSGTLLVGGRDISHAPANKRDMGMVFQSYSLFPTMTALDNVGFGLRVRGRSKTMRRERAAELLDLVGLAEHRDKFPHQLSGGQQQRVALARALAIEPRVLLLDEPLSGADRVGGMRQGRLEQCATPIELYDRPSTAFVAEFVGTMNHLAGTVAGARRVRVREQTLAVQGDVPADGSAVTVLVRPEAIVVTPSETGDAIIVVATFQGATTRLRLLREDSSEVLADVPSHRLGDLGAGSRVAVTVLDQPVLLAESR